MTNQTTYELVRRRRISYLRFVVKSLSKELPHQTLSTTPGHDQIFILFICRGIPERVYPFSRGLCRNLYNFCCGRSSMYELERLPNAMELEEKARPYTCLDFLTCRCCWQDRWWSSIDCIIIYRSCLENLALCMGHIHLFGHNVGITQRLG